jgi:hypothetical protein
MSKPSRRDALQALGASVLALSSARFGLAQLGAPPSKQSLNDWLRRLEENAQKQGNRTISPLQWQEEMDAIYGATPLSELKQHLRFDSLVKALLDKMPADRGEYFEDIDLSKPVIAAETTPSAPEPHQKLIVKIAHVKKGASIPPHGHSNMVSAFLCLTGEFEVRLFDRLADRENELVIRQSMHEKKAGPGTWSSVSDYRDNVHWLTARSDDCILFTCKLLTVEPNLPLNGRINIDVPRAKELGTGTFLAPKITAAQAKEVFG